MNLSQAAPRNSVGSAIRNIATAKDHIGLVFKEAMSGDTVLSDETEKNLRSAIGQIEGAIHILAQAREIK